MGDGPVRYVAGAAVVGGKEGSWLLRDLAESCPEGSEGLIQWPRPPHNCLRQFLAWGSRKWGPCSKGPPGGWPPKGWGYSLAGEERLEGERGPKARAVWRATPVWQQPCCSAPHSAGSGPSLPSPAGVDSAHRSLPLSRFSGEPNRRHYSNLKPSSPVSSSSSALNEQLHGDRV